MSIWTIIQAIPQIISLINSLLSWFRQMERHNLDQKQANVEDGVGRLKKATDDKGREDAEKDIVNNSF